MCALIFSKFVWSISHSKKKWVRYDIIVYRSSCKVPLLVSDFNETWIFWQIFETPSSIKFHENPSSWNRVVPCGRTDRRMDMAKLIVALRNFANAPNIELCLPARPSVCEIPNYEISYWRAVGGISFHFLSLWSNSYFEVMPKHNLLVC